ncbi:MAG: lipoprotein N-acyltransferase Lnb domain-containing protein [Flagellimonas sp.]
MRRKPHLLFFFLIIGKFLFSQAPELTENSKISLLTCAAGDELYSAFGHTAFRVQDPSLGIDVVYNYGTFDFNQPNFYLNFTKGRMIYSLSRRNFETFLYEYELEKRWVKEQILDLNLEQRNQLLAFFEENYLPQNRDYAYDPLLNNCSSITGDILKEQFGDAVVFNDFHLEKRYTFRQLVRQFMDVNTWSMFGIDLAFGSPVDRKATVLEHIFLPYYAMEQLRNTTLDGAPLVKRERTILDYSEHTQRSFFPLSPLFWFILLMAFTGIITYFDYKHKARSRWLDFSLLFITGFAGSFLFLLWVAADHTSTPYNYNILWAFPINIIVAFALVVQDKVPQWVSKYLWYALVLIGIVLLLWIIKVQIFSPVLIPLLLTLAIRYVYMIKYSKL